MKNRRYLKKIACLITLAVTLNLTCISISTLAEGTAEENKAVENVQNNVEGQKEEKEKTNAAFLNVKPPKVTKRSIARAEKDAQDIVKGKKK